MYHASPRSGRERKRTCLLTALLIRAVAIPSYILSYTRSSTCHESAGSKRNAGRLAIRRNRLPHNIREKYPILSNFGRICDCDAFKPHVALTSKIRIFTVNPGSGRLPDLPKEPYGFETWAESPAFGGRAHAHFIADGSCGGNHGLAGCHDCLELPHLPWNVADRKRGSQPIIFSAAARKLPIS